MALSLKSNLSKYAAFIQCTLKYCLKRSLVLLRAIPLPLLLLIIISAISGCASNPQSIRLGVGDNPPTNEAIVFGKMEFPSGMIGNLAVTEFTPGTDIIGAIYLVNEKSEKILACYSKMNDGKCDLLWHLPVGDYLILRLELSWKEGFEYNLSSHRFGPKMGYTRTYTLLARFSVPPNESAVYIGDLMIIWDGINYVDDKFENSVETLRSQYPNREIEPIKELMQLEVVE